MVPFDRMTSVLLQVTGLLMAIVTRRALILDFSNDTYTGTPPCPTSLHRFRSPVTLRSCACCHPRAHLLSSLRLAPLQRSVNLVVGDPGECSAHSASQSHHARPYAPL
jgi:hypothetical protein